MSDSLTLTTLDIQTDNDLTYNDFYYFVSFLQMLINHVKIGQNDRDFKQNL